VTPSLPLIKNVQFTAFVQYEKWLAPILIANPQTNWTSSVEVTFWPTSLDR
jgi:hypothetical protein